MAKLHSHLEIALGSIRCFTDDGTLDANELNFLLGLALRDDRVDDDERRVLRDIFSQVGQSDVSPTVWQRIEQARTKYGI